MRPPRTLPLAAVTTILLVSLCACDGADILTPVDGPPGGGVGGGALDGTLDVRVIDARARTPVAGASVSVGLDGASVISATTDASGRARLRAAAISGVVDVQVRAAGYVATAWIGVSGRAVTVPLTAAAAPTTTMVAVTVRGIAAATSTGPSMGSVEVYLAASAPQPVTGLPPALEPPAAPACMLTFGTDTCSANVPAQDGTRAMVATLVVSDTRGTVDPADDTRSVAGFAVTRGVSVAPSAAVTLDARATATAFDLRFDDAPPGLAGVIGVPGLASASEGVAFFANEASPAQTRLAAPVDVAGGSGGATFWVLAVASAPAGDSQSVIVRRQLADTAAPVALGAWLEPPVVTSSPTSEPPILTFDAVGGAAIYALEGRDPAGALVANAFVLSGAGRLTAHMPAGAADTRWTVRAIDAPSSASDTDLERVDREAARLSLTRP